ncbi:hypothetical protein Vretimale_5933 [Volvox reticuliferus]|uniref:Protein kinase domain-containing protein n=1 Tax=Volvox reticuliferus TaxID=1737510 RepID=A0A8J4LKG5_9CHLO|nr:hypothetical protein Vretimale_5933 [Volvox reticuliferus]
MQIALREVQLLKAVSHPNIIKLQSAFRTPSGRVCMVFEYGGKSTHQLLETRFPRGFSQPLLRRLTFQIVQALCYLHSRKIIHRDVKPANILVDSEGVLRLCDFGFARYLSGSANSEAVLLSATRNNNGDGSDGGDDSGLWTPYVITRWYRAPEVLLGMPYGTPTDVWSLGCTLAELATGEPLFPGTSSLDQIGRIAALLGPLPNHMAARVTGKPRSGVALPADGKVAVSAAEALRQRLRPQQGAEFLELLTACLRTDPRDRPTVEQLLRMPYLADAAKLFEGSSLGHAYIAAPLTGPVQAARKLAPPSQPFPAPQPPSTDGMQSAKTELMPVPPGHCRFHRCHPHPPPHQQHIHHHQQHQQTYHGNYQQQRCSIYPQKQQQQDSRSRDVFRCSRGLQHSASMGSSVDAGSTITSASCSVMSITPVMRSVTSVTDSSFSTVPLGSSTCCYHCSGGAAGVASDTVCTCHAEASNFVPGSASNAQPLLSPAAAAAAAVETSSCQVDNGINRGSSISACIAGKAAPEQLEGLQCARKAAADHPPVGGISVGSGDGMQDGITGACLRSTAVASSLVRGLKSHDSTAPMASSLSELLDVTVTLPSSLCVPAAEAGPSAPAVHLDSRPAPPHPSDFSREAAIRAMTAAAAFASDGSAAEGTLATAMTSCHSVAGVQSALPVYRDHHYQHQQQCFDSSSGRSSSSSDSEQVRAWWRLGT